MPLYTLKDLFVHELRDLYDAESQSLKALSRLAERAHSDELRAALEEHQILTKKHVARLDRIFEKLGVSAEGQTCNGMKGLIKEAEKLLEEDAEDAIRDAGLIAAAQRMEHYEISAYGTARTFADSLGFDEFAWILTETLEDEREADQRLSSLAESAVNVMVAEGSKVG
jgi:ferritin-like metal-binding protein YciE